MCCQHFDCGFKNWSNKDDTEQCTDTDIGTQTKANQDHRCIQADPDRLLGQLRTFINQRSLVASNAADP